jgi:hypothetical protein
MTAHCYLKAQGGTPKIVLELSEQCQLMKQHAVNCRGIRRKKGQAHTFRKKLFLISLQDKDTFCILKLALYVVGAIYRTLFIAPFAMKVKVSMETAGASEKLLRIIYSNSD